ncbi:hypothetical protein ACQKQD_31790 [Methylobacterium sp. NPDC080182]|uniref:hypothetical protein n=1 Tax=Methylobacterium sp. NPDC080182 TaxID=3390590 RepID=UPI003D03B2B9
MIDDHPVQAKAGGPGLRLLVGDRLLGGGDAGIEDDLDVRLVRWNGARWQAGLLMAGGRVDGQEDIP